MFIIVKLFPYLLNPLFIEFLFSWSHKLMFKYNFKMSNQKKSNKKLQIEESAKEK